MRPLPGSDWKLAEALYLRGLPNSEIVAAAHVTPGSLRRRACRYKWNDRRAHIKSLVSQHDTAENLTKAGNASAREPVHTRDTQNDGSLRARLEVKVHTNGDEPGRGMVLRQKLKGKLEPIIDALPTVLPEGARATKDLLTGIASVVGAAKEVEGWNDPTICGKLDLDFLSLSPSMVKIVPSDAEPIALPELPPPDLPEPGPKPIVEDGRPDWNSVTVDEACPLPKPEDAAT